MAPNWFIAFPMQVEGLRLHLPAPPRVRVFASSDLHTTLVFLGDVQVGEAQKAWDRVGDFRSFRRVVGSFSVVEPLGHPRKPSALAAMVDAGRDTLSEMINEARGAFLKAAGAPEDTRPPLPHMTLARIQRRANPQERREALSWAKAIDLSGVRFTVPSLALYTWSDDRQERLFQIVERHAFAR